MASVINEGVPGDRPVCSSHTHNIPVITDQEFYKLRDFIHAHTGIALAEHKRTLLCSRLGKRLRYYGIESYSEYYDLLTKSDADGSELIQMINAITTNKTDFFREDHHFKFLSQHAFPQIKVNNKNRRIRLWSAGTATGEEAYSLAIMVREAFSQNTGWDIRILATDIDTNVLNHAERGIYTSEQTDKIPDNLLHRYFLKGINKKNNYVMAKHTLKDIIRFRRLNLLNRPWPMQGKFDIIFCRNVIIYFDKSTQMELISHIARSLNRDGYLMLGHSESLHGLHSEFNHIGHSIYQYRGEG